MPELETVPFAVSINPLSRILCIEDNQAIREMLHLALAEIGHFDVHTCASGEQALEIFADQSPDMVLLDWDLPGLSGAETLKKLACMACEMHTRVVVMTTKKGKDAEASIPQKGVLALIHKPLDPMNLASRLRRLHAQAGQQTDSLN